MSRATPYSTGRVSASTLSRLGLWVLQISSMLISRCSCMCCQTNSASALCCHLTARLAFSHQVPQPERQVTLWHQPFASHRRVCHVLGCRLLGSLR